MKDDDDDNGLDMWVVYWSPRDYPNTYVARKWRIFAGDLPMPISEMFTSPSLAELRALLPPGAVNIGRMPQDEAQIVEVWV
jgi:hypothetical protein